MDLADLLNYLGYFSYRIDRRLVLWLWIAARALKKQLEPWKTDRFLLKHANDVLIRKVKQFLINILIRRYIWASTANPRKRFKFIKIISTFLVCATPHQFENSFHTSTITGDKAGSHNSWYGWFIIFDIWFTILHS